MKKWLVLTLLITILSTSFHAIAKAEEGIAGISKTLNNIEVIYNYTTERVNLRKEASTNSDIILTLDKRVKVTVLKISSSGNWTNVIYDGKVGYVNSKYLRENELFTSDKNKWGIELTNDEIDLLAKIVWLEARGEIKKGRHAVIEIVFNRMISLQHPDTLKEVLSEEGQFTTWKNRDNASPTEETYEDIQNVLNNKTNILNNDYIYFGRSPINNNDAIKIGNHYFCKL